MKKVIVNYTLTINKCSIIDLDELDSTLLIAQKIKRHLYNFEGVADEIKIKEIYSNNYNKQDLYKLNEILKNKIL